MTNKNNTIELTYNKYGPYGFSVYNKAVDFNNYINQFDLIIGDIDSRYCVILLSSNISRSHYNKVIFTNSILEAKKFAKDWLNGEGGAFKSSEWALEYHYYVMIIDLLNNEEIDSADSWLDSGIRSGWKQLKESNSAYEISYDTDSLDTIGKLNPGDKFKNRNGAIITIEKPTKDGRVLYSNSIDDEVRIGTQRSIQLMLYKNNYLRIDESLNESVSVYEIVYDVDSPDSGETYKDNYERFEGSWLELLEYIKQLKRNGCYNINANYMYDYEDALYGESFKVRNMREDLEDDLDYQLTSDGFERTAGHDYRSGYDYIFYRKMVNGKGKWKAIQTDRNGNKEIIDVTYDLVRGFEPITGIEKTARFLGKKLLPQREALLGYNNRKNSKFYTEAELEKLLENDVEEMRRIYHGHGDKSPDYILRSLGYKEEDEAYYVKEMDNGYALVIDLIDLGEDKNYDFKYFMVDKTNRIPKGWTVTKTYL